ncbi:MULTISPECIES: bifunctional tRNA (5-methylaminomethyl-2-thiouridine)(34)-methyltransferase MnmD/FAD-dependent 5-carboxymethylaminomethyl-2-thiouridine(34) oxidoreductase MnmC [Idiomarina]|uniref:bifunctional tRNA (5-methylaminomethyl-2-thiouridine)(34)-methyltransferase MnmD/FAD-dependent 5-carboxymethylaminomethyl-2-thiouridine(34) oxidoreductase MnmC n=1 Tax=Idiomarina TaxID=135575 RepID=UPI0013897DCF|nr:MULTISPECIES: bifunctional tRNA (5-methylaminomethyl-2-thiouridine)(34)-methyltransferase MnmD/FAD-dependent 5-carboxymethylaminomethyl-2-thiouridine(34) oxidoreductase MnmC [Idiomarina]UUN12476.1 bifunctional tRNA (5-methylaminomethyl-2-thiouridine)(34)-methyltransferase MnmD/FAD-dependent 5-carboxymethylaminomethyl-2-thiouridine(34) oxidoreductase MnmC [Idiomarina loihiensis]
MSKLPPQPVQPAQISYNDHGLPVATAFDDIYFTNSDGLAESRYVFLQHNDLPQRWQTHPHPLFVVAESGFGTGLNFLACWHAFMQQAPSSLRLHFVSFEKYPLARADLQRALAHFPELAELAAQLQAHYPAAEAGCHRLQFAQGRVTLDLWFGDILDLLPAWPSQQSVDAWFLDGFAPDKNPAMWQPELFNAMVSHARAGCTFATFTAAGAVRRGLQAAGFSVLKVKGFGHKREMLRGVLCEKTGSEPTQSEQNGAARATAEAPQLAIIGGGIAAACLAWSLTRRGHAVTLYTTGIASGASGNAQGAVYPLLHAQFSPLAQFFVGAFHQARQFYAQYAPACWHPSGVLQLGFNQERQQRQHKLLAAQLYHAETVHGLSAATTQQHWAELPAQPSLFYPRAGWVSPAKLVADLLQQCGELLTIIELGKELGKEPGKEHQEITAIKPHASGWHLYSGASLVGSADLLWVAAGAAMQQLLAPWQLQFSNVRGQVTQVAATATSSSCPTVVCYKGYFTPAEDGRHCVGATYARNYPASLAQQPQTADQQENLATLIDNLGPTASAWAEQLEAVADRAAERNTTRDHLPACGWLTPTLAVLGGLGSRGFTSAPLAAEILVSQWLQEPLPLATELLQRLAPQRLQAAPA